MTKRPDFEKIEREAIKILLGQRLSDIFELSLFDMRRIDLKGRAVIGKLSAYEKRTGEALSRRPEGVTVKYGGATVILYDDTVKSRKRVNWSIAHEVGHVVLGHTGIAKKSVVEELQANVFAAELLMPDPVIRFLDQTAGRALSDRELAKYFNVSITACKKRRTELDRRDPIENPDGDELISALFSGMTDFLWLDGQ